MPKIRGIKPETWTDEKFVELSPLARLLFIGLWNYACDNGHLEDKPKQIKMRVLPADDCNCSELLRELAESGRIVRADGWITIPTLSDHQRIDKRWFVACEKSGCTKPVHDSPDSQRKPRGGHDEATTRPPRKRDVASRGPRADVDGDVDGDLKVSGVEYAPADAEDATRTPDLIAEWIEHCDDRPPSRVIGQISKEVKSMLTEGIEYERVRAGLAEWNRKGLHPSTLASVVHELATKKPAPSKADQRMRANLAVVEQLRAEEATQLRAIEGNR